VVATLIDLFGRLDAAQLLTGRKERLFGGKKEREPDTELAEASNPI
jgi:hypothetical protein